MYICTYCQKIFNKKYNLNRHLDKKQKCYSSMSISNIYSCNICKKKYSSKGNLNKHKTKCKLKLNDAKISNLIEENAKLKSELKTLKTWLNKENKQENKKSFSYDNPNLNYITNEFIIGLINDHNMILYDILLRLLNDIYFNPQTIKKTSDSCRVLINSRWRKINKLIMIRNISNILFNLIINNIKNIIYTHEYLEIQEKIYVPLNIEINKMNYDENYQPELIIEIVDKKLNN